MKKGLLTIWAILFTIGTLATPAQARDVIDDENFKAVGQVAWHKNINIDPQALMMRPVPNKGTSLFFVRPSDDDPVQTSVNIAINDRFLVSLQPGNYTHVYSCAGLNRISGEITGLKTNNLTLNTQNYNLLKNGTYFFNVEVDEHGVSTIAPIDEQAGLAALQGSPYQAHQITRVIPICPSMPQQPVPPPVLKEKVSIELEVLFDNDKTEIKPEYFIKVQKVADFMNKYSSTNAIIEGHTDSNADDVYNQDLSERRADAVKTMLIERFGIDADRLSTVGYGETRPRASNATAAGRQLNRRVIAQVEER